MKRLAAIVISVLLVASIASAATVNAYQVTGPVTAIDKDMITVEKDGKPWQIARDASTKIVPDVKVGTKVTVYYRMTAASIELPPPPKTTPKKK